MRVVFFFLAAVHILSGCGETADHKEKNDADVGEINVSEGLVFTSENACKARFTTNFDSVGFKYVPLEKTANFSLQVATGGVVKGMPSFTNVSGLEPHNVARCEGLSKVVMPSLFMEKGRALKNDLSLNIIFSKADEVFAKLKPELTEQIIPQAVQLRIAHQLAYASAEETKGRTIFRTGELIGTLNCTEPFIASCTRNARSKGDICGTYTINPPHSKCQLSFPDYSIEVSQGTTLSGVLGGIVDFTQFDIKKVFMHIDHIEFH